MGKLHDLLTRAEEGLLARTLVGRRLERDVAGPAGVLFRRGEVIDKALLDRAREEELLEEVAACAEAGTSDTELEELFRWLRQRRAQA